SLLEIATAVDLQLPLLVVIINDASYGAEVHDFQPLGVDVSVAQSTLRNWAGVAGALGATAHSVRSIADLEPLRSWLSSPQGPLMLDCQVNPAVDATSVMTDEGLAEWSCAE
ncbi:MAG: thiamine pyrophosphate-dependent enzyme, partial [Actinomycetales bacterium]